MCIRDRIGTHLCYAVFLLWAYLPEHVLHDLGVTYYPSKYWAVAVRWRCRATCS